MRETFSKPFLPLLDELVPPVGDTAERDEGPAERDEGPSERNEDPISVSSFIIALLI